MSSSSPPSTPGSFATIVEKVEEEERAAEETARCPPSPLAHYYTGLTLSDRYAWPNFLGDWAFVDGCQPRRVSTGCLDENTGENTGCDVGWRLQRQIDENYAKDDMAVGRLSHMPPMRRDAFVMRHVTVNRRNSVCDIEFHFPMNPVRDSPILSECHSAFQLSSLDSSLFSCGSFRVSRLGRPCDLSLSLTASTSVRTSISSASDWEVITADRQHIGVSTTYPEWVLFLCFLVFVSLSLGISVHTFVFIILGLQTMYYLLLSVV